MTSSVRLAIDKEALEERRAAAIAAIIEQTGSDAPEIRAAGWPKPLAAAEYLIGLFAVDVFALERIAVLTAQVSELTAHVAALSAAKKGTK